MKADASVHTGYILWNQYNSWGQILVNVLIFTCSCGRNFMNFLIPTKVNGFITLIHKS